MTHMWLIKFKLQFITKHVIGCMPKQLPIRRTATFWASIFGHTECLELKGPYTLGHTMASLGIQCEWLSPRQRHEKRLGCSPPCPSLPHQCRQAVLAGSAHDECPQERTDPEAAASDDLWFGGEPLPCNAQYT